MDNSLGTPQIKAATMAFHGLRMSGYTALPPAAEPLVSWFAGRLAEADVDDCEAAITSLASLLDGGDARLRQIVEQYCAFVGTREPKRREMVHAALIQCRFAEQELLEAIEQSW